MLTHLAARRVLERPSACVIASGERVVQPRILTRKFTQPQWRPVSSWIDATTAVDEDNRHHFRQSSAQHQQGLGENVDEEVDARYHSVEDLEVGDVVIWGRASSSSGNAMLDGVSISCQDGYEFQPTPP